MQGSSLTNLGMITGQIAFGQNSYLSNAPGATINATVPWSVPTNAVLVNNGTITQTGVTGGGGGLTVGPGGTLMGRELLI